MDGFELFQLGRTLMKLGEQAMPQGQFRQLSAPTRAVLFDITENPDSSINDIAGRVRFPQSQVTASRTGHPRRSTPSSPPSPTSCT